MTGARLAVAGLGLVLLGAGAGLGTVVARSGTPWVWGLYWGVAAYGAWLLVQARRARPPGGA